jgi:hypothetical protein
MLHAGDFDQAFLVYCEGEPPHICGEIESWPISRIDELAAKLAAEARS